MKTIIIAEAGKNFIYTQEELSVGDNLTEAQNLALAAKNAGADIVKFQTHVWEDEQYLRDASRKEWTLRNERATPLKEFWIPLTEYCDEIGIEFLSTGMSLMATKKINPLVRRYKIGSGNIQDEAALEWMARQKKPVIISSGMSTQKELDRAVTVLRQYTNDITIMHCVSEYPCEDKKVNLSIMDTYRWRYQTEDIGYSDHSLSTMIPAVAVAMGAKVIEKHFTFDRNAFGPDHKASLLPAEFKEMVNNIRLVDMLKGDPERKLTKQEEDYRKIFKKNG